MLNFLGKKLLFVVAHPDDESFTASGTIWENHLAGGKNFILCATLGEQGKSHLKKPVSQSKLKQIRKQEITQTAKFLKVDRLMFLALPDTKVGQHQSRLAAKIIKTAKKLKPDFIFSFGPDGFSGHLDHIAAGSAAREAAKKLCKPFIAFVVPPEFAKNFKLIKKRRKFGTYSTKVIHKKPNIKISVNPKITRKTLSFHKSQSGPSTMSLSAAKQNFQYEFFKA